MRSQTVAVSVALLGLCCLIIPRGGESAGGIISLSQAGDTLQDQSLDEPQTESLELAAELVGRSTKRRRSTEEAVKEGKSWKFVFQRLNIQTGRQGLWGLSSIKDVRATFEINSQPFSLTALGVCLCPHLLAATQGNKQKRRSSLAPTKVEAKTSRASCKQTHFFPRRLCSADD